MPKKSFSVLELRERDSYRMDIQNLLSFFRIAVQECGNLDTYSTEDLKALVAMLKKYKSRVHSRKISLEGACQEILNRIELQRGGLITLEKDE